MYSPTDAVRLSLGGEAGIHPTVRIDASQREFDGSTTTLLDTNPTYQVYAAYLLGDARIASWLRINAGADLMPFSYSSIPDHYLLHHHQNGSG